MSIGQQSEMKVQIAQATLLYAAPVVILLYYLIALGLGSCILQKGRKYRSIRLRRTILGLVSFTLATYFLQSAVLLADAFASTSRISSIPANVIFHHSIGLTSHPMNALSATFC